MKREFSLRLSRSPTFLWCLSELGKVGKEISCFKQRLAETDCHSSIEPRSKIARPQQNIIMNVASTTANTMNKLFEPSFDDRWPLSMLIKISDRIAEKTKENLKPPNRLEIKKI
jgi:hypothetical protein